MSTRHKMICDIVINDFEGPLDLLLHLIKENNIDILNINVELITNQYLSYINRMEELNINVASSYLVMASELILLKSKSLLPSGNVEQEKEEELTKEKLTNRLLEYKKYKEVSEQLSELADKRNDIFIKLPENRENYATEILSGSQSVANLLQAFNSFLERNKYNKPLTTKVTTKEYSVKERSLEIRKMLYDKKELIFSSLFSSYQRDLIIVTFLSVLEMVKEEEVVIEQAHNFEEIKIRLRISEDNE